MDNDDVLLPRFFKVFLSESASESMAIPKSFLEHLEDPLPQTAKLQGTGVESWTVSLTKIRDRAYFTTGWSKFAEDHDLKDGEFLTFVYDGSHTFEVSIYGHSGCKETRNVTQMVEISDEEEEEEDTLMDTDDDSSYNEEISPSITMAETEETETDTQVIVGSSNLEVMTNLCFDTTLKNRIYELLIPATVVKDNALTFGESITYIDAEGSMVGKRGKWADDRVCFKGWGRICRRNRLRVQDSVKCELLHTGKVVHSVKIHITRG